MKAIYDVRGNLRDNKLFGDGWTVGLIVANVAVLLLVIGWAVTHIKPTEIQVPIRFTSLTNFDALGEWYQLYELPVVGVLILGINLFLAAILHKKNQLMSVMVLMVSLMALVLLFAILFGFSSPSYVHGT